jgi:alpha 1,6-mannosyltransferase
MGIEADTDPNTNQYWRMGYSHPVQLTNWAMASARQHPILYRYMDRLQDKLVTEKYATMQSENITRAKAAKDHDPLTRTGPAAVTDTAITWLKKQVGLRWNALTGRKDGGRAKLASDVLVLPITGFRYVFLEIKSRMFLVTN